MAHTGVKAEGQDILTDRETEIFNTVLYVFICTPVAVLGIGANIINIIIFSKQGFAYTVNISFCGLAVSDMFCLVNQIVMSVFLNPLLVNSDISFIPVDINYLSVGTFTQIFSRITTWITLFITAERCLSIAKPLTVKQIVTANRTGFIIVLIYLINFIAFCPEYIQFFWDWKFVPAKNKTLFGIVIRDESSYLEILNFASASIASFLPVIAVIVCTGILVSKLGEKSAWRKQATQCNPQKENVSIRERNTVKMIVLIAVVLIVCYFPGVALLVVSVVEPEFAPNARYENAFVAIWAIPFLFQEVNSSINIVLYYKMSTKYRITFQQLFKRMPSTPLH